MNWPVGLRDEIVPLDVVIGTLLSNASQAGTALPSLCNLL